MTSTLIIDNCIDYNDILEVFNNIYTNMYVYQSHIIYDHNICNNINIFCNILKTNDYPVKTYMSINDNDFDLLCDDISKYRIFIIPIQYYHRYISLMKVFFKNISFLVCLNNTTREVNKIISIYNTPKNSNYLSISF